MSIIIDICLIIAVLLSSVVTAPNEILYIFTNGWGTFMLSIGILWLVGVWVRISFQSHVLRDLSEKAHDFSRGMIANNKNIKYLYNIIMFFESTNGYE
jgi:hypothetical protein